MSNTGDSQELWLETEVEIEPEKNTQLLCCISVQNVLICWNCGLVHLLPSSFMDTAFHTSGCRACILVGACIVRRWKRKACRCKDSAFHWCLPSNVSTLVPQCLLQGFRRFTYYLDRPDVMSKFTSVRLEADESKCPILQLDCEWTPVTILVTI